MASNERKATGRAGGRSPAFATAAGLIAMAVPWAIAPAAATGIAGDEALQVLDWSEDATFLRAFHYDRRSFICPQTDDPAAHPIWGTEFYTDNSSICTAAVHFGVITAEGGKVTIQELDGLVRYEGSERNGIVSQSYGDWFFSFQFVDTFPTRD